ncbi:MAG: hypothetical protein HYY30_06690 [Chloroflexi bacterium]|nr:hypothetical protein [Chloroflexota bacterium]
MPVDDPSRNLEVHDLTIGHAVDHIDLSYMASGHGMGPHAEVHVYFISREERAGIKSAFTEAVWKWVRAHPTAKASG